MMRAPRVRYDLSDELGYRIAIVQQVLRPAAEIEQGGRGVDPEDVVERRQDVLGIVGARGRVLAVGARGADVLSHLEPAAREEHAAGAGPVVPAAVLVDPRRASEFAPDDDA